jgi:hypothetical protein
LKPTIIYFGKIDYKLRHCDTVPLEANCYWGGGLNEGGWGHAPTEKFCNSKDLEVHFYQSCEFLAFKNSRFCDEL